MNIQYNTLPQTSVGKMKDIRLIIRAYLGLRNCAVSRKELLKIAKNADIHKTIIYDTIRYITDLSDYEDCDLGSWWGFEDGSSGHIGSLKEESKDLWLRLYEMTEEEKGDYRKDLEWFDNL